MSVDIAVVPVAGLGTRLLPATKSQPKEMLPVGRKPVVQYVVEELTARRHRRVLFVTGPGKTSIENHFDIDAELDPDRCARRGKEELLAELEFERAAGAVLLHAPARRRSASATPCCARGRSSATSRSWSPSATRSSASNAQSDVVRRMCDVLRGEAAPRR